MLTAEAIPTRPSASGRTRSVKTRSVLESALEVGRGILSGAGEGSVFSVILIPSSQISARPCRVPKTISPPRDAMEFHGLKRAR